MGRSVIMSQHVARALDVLQHGVMRDDQDLVEADVLHALQFLADLIGRADERGLRDFGKLRRTGAIAEIDCEVRKDRVAYPPASRKTRMPASRSSQLL